VTDHESPHKHQSVDDRLAERARAWGVVIERTLGTDSSLLGFGHRGIDAVVLKIVKRPSDEWMSGAVVGAFGGRGMVRVHEYVDGALLLEQLTPGHSLVTMTLEGADDSAVEVVADVVQQMSATAPLSSWPTVHEWATGFQRYLESADRRIPIDLVHEGHEWFFALAVSQGDPRLLHGDLHHYNILLDATRGWLAVDPKGVVGEREYEVGAMLRNPVERPDLFLSAQAVERRVTRLANRLRLNVDRIVGWAFAQAVLSAVWELEDGSNVDDENATVRLAKIIRPMLPPVGSVGR
jgi:streptomycin 6-kinase